MAKDRRKVIHIHSSIEDRQPTPQSLEYGELGVNYNADNEFISTKNSNDKVVRFSSDEQIVTIMEKKEVMPYEGMVRGEVGPDGTKDGKGSYGITNNDLLNNKSNIIIKLNQVVAGNTAKHDKVNGSKDIYNQLVNPTTDSGLNDGAGFAIDMSRYAMIDANPSFSSLTVTDKTDLSGNTTISDGNGEGTHTGNTFNIKTTNVVANDTNWTETITNKTSTISNSNSNITTSVYSGNTLDATIDTVTTKFITLSASAQTADYSGGTLNSHIKDVTHSGDSISIVENSIDITSCNGISAKTNDFEVIQCSPNADGKFVVNQKTSTISGNTMVVNELESISVNTPSINVSGTNLTLNEANTVISSCTKIDIITDDLNIKQCSSNGGAVDFEFCSGYNVKSNAVKIEECDDNEGSIIIKESATNISGDTLTVFESGATDFNGGTLSITTTEGTEINSSANTIINTVGNTAIHSDGKLGLSSIGELSAISTEGDMIITADKNICESSGENVGIAGVKNTFIGQTCNGVNVTTGDTVIYGETNVNISGSTITESGDTVNINGESLVNLSGDVINVIGASDANINGSDICIEAVTELSLGAETVNVGTDCSGTTTANTVNVKSSNNIYLESIFESHSATIVSNTATTINNNVENYNVTASAETHTVDNLTVDSTDICLNASDSICIGGDVTNIGTNCSGESISSITNIYGNVINNSATTYNITGITNLNGDVYIDNDSKLYLTPDCPNIISSTTVNAALCEILGKGNVTMTKDENPSDSRLSATYKLYQNGEQIGYDINVPKDGFLKNVELVNVNNVYYLRFTWNIYDSDSGTYETGSTDVNVADLAKDIDENNTKSDRGVNVDVWYNETDKKMNVSADTTVVIKSNGGATTKTFSKSNATNTLTSYTLTTSAGSYTSSTDISFDPFNANAKINIPTDAAHISNRSVSWSYGSVTGESSGSYTPSQVNNGSFVIPKCVGDMNRSKLNYSYGSVSAKTSSDNGTYDPGEACNNAITDSIVIPTCIADLKNWNGSCYSFDDNVCVTGDVTATGSFYSTSDERKKENIEYINKFSKISVRNVPLKSFNYKEDESKRKLYGVIAQDVEAAGLNELVHINEEGIKSVDYTSFLILRISYLEKLIGSLNDKIAKLEQKIENNK